MAPPNKAAKVVQKAPLGAAALAHALACPLDELLAMATLLQRQSLPEAAHGQLEAILGAGRRMAALISDAQDTEGLATPPNLEAVSLRELVDEVEAFWKACEPRHGAQPLISFNAPKDLRVLVDPARLHRLLDTLIEDALNTCGGGVVDIQLSTLVGANGVVSVLGRIDAPGSARQAGDDVALNLCRAIVLQMDGDISRIPNPGAGDLTSFIVRLADAGRLLTENQNVEPEDAPLPPRTHLLIVDDNATNRIVAAALCEMFGCTSETAEDGLEAVEAVKSRHFDLILMDIKMPRMDGLEAARAIRALPSPAANTPIVALTANADPDAVQTYIASGMQGVVDKPIKPQTLLTTLQGVLCGHVEPAAQQTSVA